MCGRETLAMAVSSNSMNVASVTVVAMSHGFTVAVFEVTTGNSAATDAISRRRVARDRPVSL